MKDTSETMREMRAISSIILLLLNLALVFASVTKSSSGIVVVGSINADVIVPLEKMPVSGETVVAINSADVTAGQVVAGGKGANQAVACQRLGATTRFLCQFGNDGNAEMLESTVRSEQIDISHCPRAPYPSGTGLVLLVDGGSTCIVCPGSNFNWDLEALGRAAELVLSRTPENTLPACVMLQMEVPTEVNTLIARAAAEKGIPVFQDVGGADRSIDPEHLKLCTFLSPNLSELKRLTKMPCNTHEEVLDAARELQQLGAQNVLVTLGIEGSLLLTSDGNVLKQHVVPAERVVDETGAGDNYRAAFCVAHFHEGRSLQESMRIASAAASVSVTKLGAIPACCWRKDCEELLLKHKLSVSGGFFGNMFKKPSDSTDTPQPGAEPLYQELNENSTFPFQFASRLNSMKERLDLYESAPFGSANGAPLHGVGLGVRGWIKRQGRIKGLSKVDFNYPQHLTHPVDQHSKKEILECLRAANLTTGAICLRFPKDMQLGALTHPDPAKRQRAIDLCHEACEWASALSCNEVVIWSAYCGYDYPLQADYDSMWAQYVAAMQQLCDKHPKVRISLEYKPTDENTRYFVVPSTGSACLLVQEVSRDNFGLTLDFGHCLMAGENPAQSVAMVQRMGRAAGKGKGTGKLFGVQLGDGHSRLGAEDGLVFGSVHRMAALEFVYYLIKTNYQGHIYFDTFPRNEDPIREAEYNIRSFKAMYRQARRMIQGPDQARVEEMLRSHDAMSMLEYLEQREESIGK